MPKNKRCGLDQFLTSKFEGLPEAQRFYVDLWRWYSAQGLADSHFEIEITTSEENFWQRVWEMVLASQLAGCGHKLSSADQGPDFNFTCEGRTVWVEAIAPRPMGLPPDWMELRNRGEVRVRDYPHQEILLRWTSAIRTKHQKLVGRGAPGTENFEPGYLRNGTVKQTDAFVVAVNGSGLAATPETYGISQVPYILEAVFPIGPISVGVERATGEFGRAYQAYRPIINNKSGAEVRTDCFLNPEYAGVSAVMGCATLSPPEYAKSPVVVVHNLYARSPIPTGILGADIEYVARVDNDQLMFDDVIAVNKS